MTPGQILAVAMVYAFGVFWAFMEDSDEDTMMQDFAGACLWPLKAVVWFVNDFVPVVPRFFLNLGVALFHEIDKITDPEEPE